MDLLPENLRKKTLLHGAKNWIIYAFRYILVYKKLLAISFIKGKLPFQNSKKIQGKIWVFADTHNQYQSLQFLDKKLPDVAWVSRKFTTKDKPFIHLIGLSRLFKLLQFPTVFRLLSPIENDVKGKLFEASGQYDFFQKLLQKYRPKALILSNDHSIAPRSLLLAANSLKIPTVYIQHASVSPFFPNLEASLNLLEGQHAYDVYKKCGKINGIVKLIGMPKFEQYQHLQNHNTLIKKIGIAFNPSDQKMLIEAFINEVVPQFPNIVFTFRKHPREERDFFFLAFPNLKESLPRRENAFEFLTQQDMIFAGDSSIHLEATLLNIVSVYFDFTSIEDKFDYYGFVKNGMIPHLKTIQESTDFISKIKENKPDVIHKAAYYNHLIQLSNRKSSTELVITQIQWLLSTQ